MQRSTGGTYSKMIECPNSRGEPSVFLNVEGSSQEVFTGQTRNLKNVIYNIDIRPRIVIKNCLPVPLHYTTGSDKANYKVLGTSETGCPEDLKTSLLLMKIVDWRDTDLRCTKIMDDSMGELERWRFDSVNPAASSVKIDLGVKKDQVQKIFLLIL